MRLQDVASATGGKFNTSYLSHIESERKPVLPRHLEALRDIYQLSDDDFKHLYGKSAVEYLEAKGWKDLKTVADFLCGGNEMDMTEELSTALYNGTFGSKVREYRNKLGWSLRKLAREIEENTGVGGTYSHYYSIEKKADYNFSIRTANAIIHTLCISLSGAEDETSD